MPDNYIITDGLIGNRGNINAVFKLRLPDIAMWNSQDKEDLLTSLSGTISRALVGETFSIFTAPLIEDNAAHMLEFENSVKMFLPEYNRPDYVPVPSNKDILGTFMTVQINLAQQQELSLKAMIKSSFLSMSGDLTLTEGLIAARKSMEMILAKISRYFDVASKEEIEYYMQHINRNNQGHQVFKSDIMSFQFEVLEGDNRSEELHAMIIEIIDFPTHIVMEQFQWFSNLPSYCEVAHNCQIIDKEKMRRRLGREQGDLKFEQEQASSVSHARKEEFTEQLSEIEAAIKLIKDPDRALAITSSAILISGNSLEELKKKSSLIQGLLNDNSIENRVVLNPSIFYVEHFKKRRQFSEHSCLVEMGFIVASGLPVSTTIGD